MADWKKCRKSSEDGKQSTPTQTCIGGNVMLFQLCEILFATGALILFMLVLICMPRRLYKFYQKSKGKPFDSSPTRTRKNQIHARIMDQRRRVMDLIKLKSLNQDSTEIDSAAYAALDELAAEIGAYFFMERALAMNQEQQMAINSRSMQSAIELANMRNRFIAAAQGVELEDRVDAEVA